MSLDINWEFYFLLICLNVYVYSPNSFQNDVEYMEIDRWRSRREKKIISNNLALREKLYV